MNESDLKKIFLIFGKFDPATQALPYNFFMLSTKPTLPNKKAWLEMATDNHLRLLQYYPSPRIFLQSNFCILCMPTSNSACSESYPGG